MTRGFVARVGTRYHQAAHFFGEEIWEARLDKLPPRRARRYRVARVLHSAIRALLFEDALHVRAAALTYFTVLSLVPLLALAFSLLKGFGAYDLLIEETVRPYMLWLIGEHEVFRSAFEKTLLFVDHTSVASLGVIGLVVTFYAATRLLRSIEGALNEIWGVSTGRQPLEQLRDYIALIVVTPICLMLAAGLTTLGQALDLLQAAGKSLGVSMLMNQALGVLGPLLVLLLGLLTLYKVMPCTHVRMGSALVGAAIGALLWYVVLVIHVRFQVGIAHYNAVYSSFGAIPLFLAWVNVSWLVVLVGAQIAATHQNHRGMAQQARAGSGDQTLREAVSLSAMLYIARGFAEGKPHPTQHELCGVLDVAEPFLAELLGRLDDAGLVVKTGSASDPAYVLGKSAELIHAKEVLDAVRHKHGSEALHGMATLDPLTARVWQQLEHSIEHSSGNRSLQELLAQG